MGRRNPPPEESRLGCEKVTFISSFKLWSPWQWLDPMICGNLIIRAWFPSQVFVVNLNVASGFLDRERAWHAYLDIWRPYFMYHAQFSHFITHLWFVRNHYEFKVVNPENIKLFQMCFENKQLLELHCCRERNSIISSAILLARKWLYLHNCMLLFLSSCFE